MFRGIVSIPHNIPHIEYDYGGYVGTFHGMLSVPCNIVMKLNNVMKMITTW